MLCLFFFSLLQLLLLEKGLELHKNKAPESLMPFHDLLEERFKQMKEFVYKEYAIKVRDCLVLFLFIYLFSFPQIGESDRSLLKDVFSASPVPLKRVQSTPHRFSEPPPALAPRLGRFVDVHVGCS